MVALFTRAWIEIVSITVISVANAVALFTRAWIEIRYGRRKDISKPSRPLHEGVD